MIPRLLLVGILFFSCSGRDRYMSEEELNAYVVNPENGLLKRVEKERTTVEIVYRPKDLVIAQLLGPDTGQWMEEAQRIDSLDYFILRLSRDGGEIESGFAADMDRFRHAIVYLTDKIAEDVRLSVGTEMFSPENSVFVPTFGTSGATSVMIIFRSYISKRRGNFSVVFNDTVLGTGRSEFEFSSDRINRIPRLRR